MVNYLTMEEEIRRNQIIFGKDYVSFPDGGTLHFHNLKASDADLLIELGFLDPEECQNESPTAEKFISDCKKANSNLTLHGYVVSPKRKNTRVTIEGIRGKVECRDDLLDLILTHRHADELEFDREGNFYCWYD